MNAIDRKMLRDLWGMRGQAIAIAFVIVAGIAAFVSMRSVMDALQRTLHSYYREYRFPDGFAVVRRAPEQLRERLSLVQGVGQLHTRVAARVNLEVPGFDDAVSGLLVSIPEGHQPELSRLFLRDGRLVSLGRENEILVNEVFAEAHELGIGDTVTAIINGRRRELRIVGIALSPEFLMQIEPGSLFPDPERFGVMWMGRNALAAAYDMDGAFNELAFTLAPGASLEDVIARIDELLEPYGGQGAFGRRDQASHFIITEEFRQLQGTSNVLPTIFIAVAAFLLNIVIARLINLQREQIAVLKAFGYTNTDVGLHYIKLVLTIAVTGGAVGTALGIWMGKGLANLYLEYYRFPYLEYALRPSVAITALTLTAGASLLGVVQSVRRAVRLPPAEAMRPAPPATYRPTFIERLGLQRRFDQPTRMILRHLERRPIQAGLTILGIASSCAILIMGLFFTDSFDHVIRIQYGLAQRENLTVVFTDPTSVAAIHELSRLPGVHYVEPFRTIPVRLRHAHRSYQTALEGVPPDPYLRRVIDENLDPIEIPPEGLVLSERLADILGVRAGDQVIVELQEGARRTVAATVAAVAQQYIGLGAYMRLEAANRLAGAGQAVSGAFLSTDTRFERKLVQALRDRPRIASISSREQAIRSFRETTAETMLVYTFILSLFAGVIAFGVVYNSARISLSERDRELASLRVLGFTRGEISYILIGELAVLTLLSIPLGLVLGTAASSAVVRSLQTDMYQLPFVLGRNTLALAAAVVLGAAIVSAGIVRRSLDRLDLVGVLKTRE